MQETFQIPARWSSADIRSIHVLTPWRRFKRVSAISFYLSTFLPFFIRHTWLFSNSEALCFTFRHNKQASLRPTLPCHRSTVSSRKTLCSSTLLQAICNSFIWYPLRLRYKAEKGNIYVQGLISYWPVWPCNRALIGPKENKSREYSELSIMLETSSFPRSGTSGAAQQSMTSAILSLALPFRVCQQTSRTTRKWKKSISLFTLLHLKTIQATFKKPACTIWLPLLLTVSSRKVPRRKRSMTYWSLRMAWTSLNQNLVLLSLWSRTILTATITRRQSSTASEPSKPMLVTKSRRRGKSASDIR